MISRTWFDDDVSLKIELAVSGDLIGSINQKDYPFQTGGVNGAAKGWAQYVSGGTASINDATWTTSLGNQNISIKANIPANQWYGITKNFSGVAGKRFQWGLKVRTIGGKLPGDLRLGFDARDSGGGFIQDMGSIVVESTADWQDISVVWSVAAPSNTAYVQCRIQCRDGNTLSGSQVLWGIQFTDLFSVLLNPPAPPAITWRDITCDVMRLGLRYGRERFTNRYDVSQLSLVLINDDGEYTYATPHPFNLRPGRQIRVTATYNAINYPMAYHVIDSIVDGYSIDGHAIVTMTCFDPTTVAANLDTPSVGYPIAGWKSGARMQRLIDVSGYTLATIDAGQWYQQRIDESGSSLRDEMALTAESEGGMFYADRSGRIIYRDRTYPSRDANLTNVTAQLAARPHTGELPQVDQIPTLATAPIVCVKELDTDWSMERVINYLELANRGGSVQVYEDETSQRQNGIRTYQRLDFVNVNDTDLDTRANDLMGGYVYPILRVDSVSYRPAVNRECWPWTLSVFLNWLVRIWYGHPTSKWGYAVVTHVQSIEHNITTDDWEVSMSVDLPLSFVEADIYPEFYWDHVAALWDTASWA